MALIQWVKKKRLLPLIIILGLVFALLGFVFFTEGINVLPAIYNLVP